MNKIYTHTCTHKHTQTQEKKNLMTERKLSLINLTCSVKLASELVRISSSSTLRLFTELVMSEPSCCLAYTEGENAHKYSRLTINTIIVLQETMELSGKGHQICVNVISELAKFVCTAHIPQLATQVSQS